jgi:hypothetical protein
MSAEKFTGMKTDKYLGHWEEVKIFWMVQKKDGKNTMKHLVGGTLCRNCNPTVMEEHCSKLSASPSLPLEQNAKILPKRDA